MAKKIQTARLHIFDMDGTLLDSMGVWQNLGRNYLLAQQITPPNDLEQTIAEMTLEESAAYFQTLGLIQTIPAIIQGITDFIRDKYRLQIPWKPGMQNILSEIHATGSKLCLLTTSEECCAHAALKRLNCLDWFDAIYTSENMGLSKRTPEIYQKVCQLQRVPPAESMVYEDALYAIRSALEAGCQVTGVYDDSSEADWQTIQTLCHRTIMIK